MGKGPNEPPGSGTVGNPEPGGGTMTGMAPARFKDLVIDATDAGLLGRFWAQAAGLRLSVKDHDDGVLTDGVDEHTIWVNAVPEPRVVKQRVHLDLLATSPGDLETLGARIEREYPGWTVMSDPEGGEFCAFARDPGTLPTYRVYELVVDAVDAQAIASWWAARLSTDAHHRAADPWWWLEPEAATGLPWPLVFNPVPEPKQVKNRVHWDVWGDQDTFLTAGAKLLRPRDAEIDWDVLADPEGNEFCVFAARP